MTKIISLESRKNQKAARRGFREWQRLFKTLPGLDEHTRWADLPDELILFLAEDDEQGRRIIYDLLMGALGLGSGYEFESLPSEKLLPLLDAYFFLLDQIRFECMRRLGWVEEIPLGQKPIIEIIKEVDQGLGPAVMDTPEIIRDHPAFFEYARLNSAEQMIFLRRSIPEAVRQFREKINPGR